MPQTEGGILTDGLTYCWFGSHQRNNECFQPYSSEINLRGSRTPQTARLDRLLIWHNSLCIYILVMLPFLQTFRLLMDTFRTACCGKWMRELTLTEQNSVSLRKWSLMTHISCKENHSEGCCSSCLLVTQVSLSAQHQFFLFF